MFEANNQALITPPVRARFFKFRIPIYSYSDERGSQPCIKVELYGSPGRLRSYAVFREKTIDAHLPFSNA